MARGYEDAASSGPEVGDQVEYWSDTHQQWMLGTLLQIRSSERYELDIKKNADRSKIRWPPVSQAANIAPDSAQLPIYANRHGDIEEADLFCGTSIPLQFHVGDRVEYWSATYTQWMPAIVKEVLGSNKYHLDCKRFADQSKIRWPQQQGTVQAQVPLSAVQEEAEGHVGLQNYSVRLQEQQQQQEQAQQPYQEQQAYHSHQYLQQQNEQRQQVQPLQPVRRQMQQQQHTNSHFPADLGVPLAAPRAAPPPIQLSSVIMGQESPEPSPVSSSGHLSVPLPVPFGASQRLLHQGTLLPNLYMGTGLEIKREPAVSGAAAMALMAAQRAHQPQAASPGPLEVGDLHLRHVESFNPQEPSLSAQLRHGLCLNEQVNIEAMTGFKGGMNQGVWFVTDQVTGQELVLKLVKCQRPAPNIPSEAENLQLLASRHPQLATDPAVAFPLKVFNCLGPDSTKRWDLIAMRKVHGERLSEWFAMAVHSQKRDVMFRMMEKLGATLAAFHTRYNNVQHGDFQPANVLLDEKKEEFFLIDIGGMGISTMETDLEHFAKSMELMALSYCPQLMAECVARFHRGYSCASQRRR